MRSALLFPLLLLIACGQSPRRQVIIGKKASRAPITILTVNKGPSIPHTFSPAGYTVHTHKVLGKYSINLLASGSSYVLLVNDTVTKKKDTLLLRNISGLEKQPADIQDISGDTCSRALTLNLLWTSGDEENAFSEVIGYRHDTLAELAAIPNPGNLIDLKRKDQNTLTGHAICPDEIVHNSYDNYEVTVSLKDNSLDIHPPDTLSLNYDTYATDTIHMYRVLPSGDHIPYTISPGNKFHLDTFYPKTRQVTLHLDDSIRLKVGENEIQLKVRGNEAY